MDKSLPLPELTLPNKADKLLLHSCCAPCSGAIIEALVNARITFSIFFYNPNIHPRREYDVRKNENIRYAQKMNIPLIDADYDSDKWFSRVKGLEYEPERGKRCGECFDMRFERAALYAHENGFNIFTSSLGIARCKNLDQVLESGFRAARRYEGLVFWNINWRKQGRTKRMCEIAKCESFYRQEYCGCVYSLRDSNMRRLKQGRDRIETG